MLNVQGKSDLLSQTYSFGEIVCSKCGIVISDKIQDTRQEWRYFVNLKNQKIKAGQECQPLWLVMIWDSLHDWKNHKDATGQVFDPSMRSTMERLRTWDLRTQTIPLIEALGLAFNELDILRINLGFRMQ